MKKTILAVAIATTSFGVFADLGVPNVDPIETPIAEKVEMANEAFEKLGVNASLEIDKNGQVHYTFTNQHTGDERTVTLSNMDEEQVQYVKDATRVGIKNELVNVKPIDPGFGVTPIKDNQIKADIANKHLNGKTFEIGASIDGSAATVSGVVVNAEGKVEALVTTTDEHGNEITKAVEYQATGEHSDKIQARIAEEIANSPKIDPIDVIVDPIEGDKPTPSEGQKIVEGLKKAADGIRDAEKDWGENSTGAIVEYSQSVQAQTQSQIDELYALGNQNATDINTLFNEVDRLDSKIDGVAAMSQASLAARPYLSTNQISSVGVGIGGAGSEAAFALGYAHRMTENWTANANVAVNTGDSAEASYGAGVSYAW
ncbi:YadA C-terminal domain-containing protein [Vibrio lentus]